MRLLILSDTHGARSRAEQVIRAQSGAKVVIHLGDGADDLEYARYEFPDRSFVQVRGNCDFACEFPEETMLNLENTRILITHGHLYRVKYTYELLLDHARQKQADLVLFGHTHEPLTGYHDGLYWMNPGSLRSGSYGVVDLLGRRGIVTNLLTVY